MFSQLFKEMSQKEDSSTNIEPESIFDKYKLGRVNSSAPFQLFETNCVLSLE